ncbi:MAG: c-type cytochrome [Acidimicrobiales bacterium]
MGTGVPSGGLSDAPGGPGETAAVSAGRRARRRWARPALGGPAALVGVAAIVFAVVSWTAPAQANVGQSAAQSTSVHSAAAQSTTAQSTTSPSTAAAHSAAQGSADPGGTPGKAPASKPAGGQTPGTVPVSTDPAAIAEGKFLYNEHCEACHGVGAVGSKGPQLLNVGPAAVDFFLSTGRMPLNAPTEEPEPHPPYFNPKQISQIVAYINAIDMAHGTPGPGIPIVKAACAKQTASCPTVPEGDQLFAMNCAQCHDSSGSGGLLSHGYLVPDLRGATKTQVAEAIRVGPRPMPNFGPGQLTQQQVDSIADYVKYLGTTPDPGGLGIAHIGPVPEGFVAIIFGLGFLLLAARLIGSRGQ